MQLTVNIGDTLYTLDARRQGNEIVVTHNGRSLQARIVRQDGPILTLARVDDNGVERTFAVAGTVKGDDYQLWVNGRSLRATRHRPQAASTAPPVDTSLAASIPAVVADVLVTPGDRVAAGDKLLLLTSMKMIMPITAPRAGRVVAVHCAAGDAVEPGIPLVELEAEAPEA